jgi:hypothetical protein
VTSAGLPTFPGSVWRGLLATWKAATDGTTDAPDVIRYAAVLLAIAVRLGRRVSLHYGIRLYGNVYIVGFGPSGGTRKTSLARAARCVIPGSVRVVRGVGSGEALIEALASSEAANSVPALLEAEELAVLLTRAKWDGASLPAILTEAYDCPDTLEVRLRKGNLLARDLFVSVLGFTTPEWFWRAMPEVHIVGGLGNRFLYLSGTPGAPIAFPPKPDERQVTVFLDELAACDAAPGGARPGRAGPLARQPLQRCAAAVEGLLHDLDDLGTGVAQPTGCCGQAAPGLRVEADSGLCLVERTLPVLPVPQLEAAIEVVDYALASTRLLVDQRGAGTAQSRIEARVVKALQEGTLPAWKIHHRLSGHCSLEDLTRALKALAGVRVVEVVKKTPRGTEVWGLTGHGKREDT